jgi:hypothetical protein
MHQAHEHALAGAVRAENDGACARCDLQRQRLDDGSAVDREADLFELERQDHP